MFEIVITCSSCELIASVKLKLEKYFVFYFCHEFKTSGDPKPLPPSPWTPLRTTVQTSTQTPLTGPHEDDNKNDSYRFDLPFVLFCFLLLLPPLLWWWKEDLHTFMSKKTDNLANLCIRYRPPIASAILFSLMLLVFSHSFQTSKIRRSISPFSLMQPWMKRDTKSHESTFL